MQVFDNDFQEIWHIVLHKESFDGQLVKAEVLVANFLPGQLWDNRNKQVHQLFNIVIFWSVFSVEQTDWSKREVFVLEFANCLAGEVGVVEPMHYDWFVSLILTALQIEVWQRNVAVDVAQLMQAFNPVEHLQKYLFDFN